MPVLFLPVRHPQIPPQGHRRQAGLTLREQENGRKPGSQRQFGAIKQGARRQRRLMMAAITLNERSGLELTMAMMTTLGAVKAVRPAQFEQRLPAGFFGAEFFETCEQAHAFLKLNHISSHVVTSGLSDGYDAISGPSQ